MTASHWEDYWASGGAGDRALGGAAQREFLAHNWSTLFAAHPGPLTIVDIGCGDGAVFACARKQLSASGAKLIALDAAPSAARTAMHAAHGVLVAAADARRLPLRSCSADIVVSQFGLEYGGERAFVEAARILKPGGVLVAICHLRGGAIHAECAENLRVLQAAIDQRLTGHARAALASTYATCADPTLPGNLESEVALRSALRHLRAVLSAASPSVARAVVGSALKELATVSARRLAYDAPEALAFVEHVEASLNAYRSRMFSMLAAACDRSAIACIGRRLRKAGLVDFEAAQVRWTRHGAPSAWRIEARRPAEADINWLYFAQRCLA